MKEKIVICINSLRTGGTERVVSILLEHLRDRFDLHLVLYNDSADQIIPEGVKVFSLSQPVKEGSIAMLLKGPFLSYRLYRYCRKNSITTVVAFLNRACYLSALTRRLFNYKGKIVMCQRTHQSTLVSYGSRWYRFFSNLLLKRSYAAADLVLANSVEIEKDLKKYLHDHLPVTMIHNPIDLEEVKRMSAQPLLHKFDPGKLHFIALGGLREEKNHALLLKAFSFVENKKAKLWIVGGGRLEPGLRKLATELNISDAVEFFGHQVNPFPFLKNADCLVLSSKVEGFPNALLEGLACGSAIISTDCKSGPREILAPGTFAPAISDNIELAEFGILVPVQNAKLLSSAMTEMMENKTLREEYSLKALERISIFDINFLKAPFIQAFSSRSSAEDEPSLN